MLCCGDLDGILLEGVTPCPGLDTLGIEVLPDNDFLAFLGDLTADPMDVPGTVVPTTLPTAVNIPEVDPVSSKAPLLALPAAVQGPVHCQVTTGVLLQQEMPSRGSPCSSAASADATNCPESPMVSSGPASSSEGAHTALASTGTVTTRRRQQGQRAAVASSAEGQRKGLQSQPPEQASGMEEQPQLTKAQLAAQKRRAPVVDWRAIDDPEERRKQRRLAKNRVTAARSRERKKEQMADMEQRMSKLEAENSSLRALLQTMMTENTSLKEQLASLTRGAAAAPTTQESSPEPAVLVKCLAIMHLVCCLLLLAKASSALVQSLLSVVLQQGVCAAVYATSCGGVAASKAAAAGQCSSGERRGILPVGDVPARREWLRVRLRPRLRGWPVS